MNSAQAKDVLRLYRPGTDDERDAEAAAALALAGSDPELKSWFSGQQGFNAGVREQLHRIEPPASLREQILAGHRRTLVRVWWRRPELLAIAAAIVVVISLASFRMSHGQDTIASYRTRMAKFALREYSMNLVTNNLGEIRAYLKQHGAPADYVLTPPVAKLPGVGCALLKWQNQPVSLVCFRLGKQDLLWLFVIDRQSLPDAPSTEWPVFQQVGKLATATWTGQGKTYLLGVIGDQKDIQEYL
jgi:hypothetical protein